LTRKNFAIDGNLLAGTHQNDVAHAHFVDENVLFCSVAFDSRRGRLEVPSTRESRRRSGHARGFEQASH
jgi:hypothetical protein